MNHMEDRMSATWRCSCGTLYTDYTGLAGQCPWCQAKIRKEMEYQRGKINKPGVQE